MRDGESSDLRLNKVVTDLTSFPVNWTELGLPQAREVLGCAGVSGIPPCNATG